MTGCSCLSGVDDAATSTTRASDDDAPPAMDAVVFADGHISRKAVMDRLRNIRKNRPAAVEEELSILSKIYSHEECADELLALGARDRGALRRFIPMMLNAILYGYSEVRPTQSEMLSMRRKSNSSRSSDVARAELDIAKRMAKRKEIEALEGALLKQCQISVDFALNTAWYLESCFEIGPKVAEHRTMSLLLRVETAVMTNLNGEEVMEPGAGPPSTRQEDQGSIEVANEQTRNVDFLLNGSFSAKGRTNSWMQIQEQSENFYRAERDFVECLTNISHDLFDIEKDLRLRALRNELTKLNDYLPRNVYVAVEDKAHRILRVVPDESSVFSTKERAPYLLTLEVEDFVSTNGDSEHSVQHTQDLSNRKEEAFVFKSTLRDTESGRKGSDPERGNEDPDGCDDTQSDDRKRSPEETKKQTSPSEPAAKKDFGAFGEPWDAKCIRIRSASPFGQNPRWRLTQVIVKARDQLRQEMFAQTLISEFAKAFKRSKTNMWVKDYRILATSGSSGLIECIRGAKSVHSIKSSMPTNLGVNMLAEFFKKTFGEPSSSTYKRAMNNFIASLAGYAVVSYILQIKDRHNGNIMMDSDGHIIHIDFGFLLSNSPGGNFEFEKAPFKLSNELVALLGGSSNLKKFCKMSRLGYAETCQASFANKILLMVDMMYQGNEDMPCFTRGRAHVLESLRARFSLNSTSKERREKWDSLVQESMRNWTTKGYDIYQKCFTGIN